MILSIQVRTKEGKVIAQISTLSRVMRRNGNNKHIMWSIPAIAIDAFAWDNYKQEFDTFEHLNKDTNTLYSITKDEFDKHKEVISFGFGDQYAVCLEYWEKCSQVI